MGEEFPSPVDRFPLEIVAETEIAQHFKEGVVIGSASDVVDVAGAETLLASSRSGALPFVWGEFHASETMFFEQGIFELIHSCGGEEYGGL